MTRDEARELVRHLNSAPVNLNWADGEASKGEELILTLSYYVPWVINIFCHRLLMLLDQEGRCTLRVDDVRRVGESTRPILDLDTLEDLKLEKLFPFNLDVDHHAIKALIAAVAHQRYFAGDQVAADPPERDPEAYAFTASDARRILGHYVEKLCAPDKLAMLKEFFWSFKFQEILDGLCLTLILTHAGIDARGGEPRYCFLNHIYPTELRRAIANGTPLDRLTAALGELIRILGGKK